MNRKTRKKVNELIAAENSRVSIHDIEALSDDIVIDELLSIIDSKETTIAEQEAGIRLRVILTTTNSDEVSGTSILSDGTKAFWGEGRSSEVALIRANGDILHADARVDIDGIYALMSGDAIGAAPMRLATEMEEAEYRMVRRYL